MAHPDPQTLALYLHWPFCQSKCPYCDFNSHVAESIDHAAWTRSYLAEMAYYAEATPGRRVTSVFFGGGTPSLMDPRTVEAVLEAARRLWPVAADVEVTLEANPSSVEAERLRAFASAGVNRVSLGIQALDDASLQFLGRRHSADEALRALEIAGETFSRWSFDLIYARPGQTPEDWERELTRALALAGGHLSLYQLTIEPGTAFFTRHARGEFTMPDEDTAATLYEMTQDRLAAAGLPAYETSNHARPGEESRHNLAYWRYEDYAGIGPGAHGRLTLGGRKLATRAHRAPGEWMARVAAAGHGGHPWEDVPAPTRGIEAVMMGLRLREGLPLARIEAETGGRWQDTISEARVRALEGEGLVRLEDAEKRLVLTDAGHAVLDGILKTLLI